MRHLEQEILSAILISDRFVTKEVNQFMMRWQWSVFVMFVRDPLRQILSYVDVSNVITRQHASRSACVTAQSSNDVFFVLIPMVELLPILSYEDLR